MKFRHCVPTLVIGFCALTVRADTPSDGGNPAAANSLTWSPSRLTADAELARYAAYHASSEKVRALGDHMMKVVDERAASEHVLLPSVTCESDLRLVRRLETLKGDDFDNAYGVMVRHEMWVERDDDQ
jgi:hypothetical protein